MKKDNITLFSVITIYSLIFLFCAAIASASYVETTVANLTMESESIIRGTIHSMKSEWNDTKTFIWTFVTVSVKETIKGGKVDGKEIIVKIPGGEVGEIGQRSSEDVVFKKGEDVMLFLNKEIYKQKEYFQVTRLALGKFTIKDDKIIEKKLPVSNFIEEIKKALRK